MEAWVAAGTFLLAIATFVLAFFTWRNVRLTRGLVEGTKLSAEAGKTAAEAGKQTVAEIQRDRELEYRPYVSWNIVAQTRANERIVAPGTARVSNFGRGPAIHCLCCLAWMDTSADPIQLATTFLFDLSPQDTGDLTLESRAGWMPNEEMAGSPIPAGPPGLRFAFCQDQLGNHYRFLPYRLEADVWREGPKPRWLDFYLEHLKALSKM
jgi:hypothetical protein